MSKRVVFIPVLEKNRTFFLVRAKDRKSCIDGYNRIMETKTVFEQFPGKKKNYGFSILLLTFLLKDLRIDKNFIYK